MAAARGIRTLAFPFRNPVEPLPMNSELRPIEPQDLAAAAHVCYHAFATIAGRHGFPADLPTPGAAAGLIDHLIGREDVHGIVALQDGRVVGSNFLWESDAVAGVGPITIAPDAQDSGLGRRLMQAVLARAAARGFASVRLVQAAYHGRSLALYARLGFDVREPLSLMQGRIDERAQLPGRHVREATAADLPACGALGAELLGHERTNELRAAVRHGKARVVEHDGALSGYTTGIGFFGHAVARHNDDLAALIAAAPQIEGLGLLLPSRNAALLRWCLLHGLRIVQPMTLMSRGEYSEPRGAFLPSILY